MRAIDADRLLTDRMKEHYYHLPNGDIAIPTIDIEHAPTILPERQRGRWVHYDEGDFDYDYKCSNCGYAVWDDSDFCPGCGADMRGGQNEAD